jgi:hypothetical protein
MRNMLLSAFCQWTEVEPLVVAQARQTQYCLISIAVRFGLAGDLRIRV